MTELSKNSIYLKNLTQNIFLNDNLVKLDNKSVYPFFSSLDYELKKTIKEIPDQRCLGFINSLITNDNIKLPHFKEHREQGNLKARIIKNYNRNNELIIINTAGGLTSGDASFINLKIKNNVNLSITTQSMEKIYKCMDSFSFIYTNIVVGNDSTISWMPLETIFFNKAKLRRRINIDLNVGSSFLGIETIIFGRKAMGESIKKGELDDAWQINRNGKLVYSDFNRLSGNINSKLNKKIIMKGNNVFCNIVYTGKKIRTYFKNILKFISRNKYFVGASVVNGILIIKILAKDISEVRSFLRGLISIFDNNFSIPKIWSI